MFRIETIKFFFNWTFKIFQLFDYLWMQHLSLSLTYRKFFTVVFKTMATPKSLFVLFYFLFLSLVWSGAAFHLRDAEVKLKEEQWGNEYVFYAGAASPNLHITVQAGMKCSGGRLCHSLFTALWSRVNYLHYFPDYQQGLVDASESDQRRREQGQAQQQPCSSSIPF